LEESTNKDLFRYIKELASSQEKSEEVAKAFYQHFVSSEEYATQLYDDTVSKL